MRRKLISQSREEKGFFLKKIVFRSILFIDLVVWVRQVFEIKRFIDAKFLVQVLLN